MIQYLGASCGLLFMFLRSNSCNIYSMIGKKQKALNLLEEQLGKLKTQATAKVREYETIINIGLLNGLINCTHLYLLDCFLLFALSYYEAL